MPQQAKKSLVLSIYFTLVVSTLLVFWQVRNFDFVNYDDDVYVYENPYVLNGLTADGVSWAFTTDCSGHWHPLTWLSLMLDCQLFGPNPGMIHLMNVLLHLVNTLLLFAVLKKMTGSLWPSAFVAAAFALHPMHVESVAWITERKDILSTLFFLLTMWAYVQYADLSFRAESPMNRGRSREIYLKDFSAQLIPNKSEFASVEMTKKGCVKWYIAALALFALGLMAKSMLVTLPFLLLLLDYWPLNRLMPETVALSGRRRREFAHANDKNQTLYRIIIEKIPFFALSVISSVITFLVMRSGGEMVDVDEVSLNNRIANVFLSYARYIAEMFWPQNLAVFYPFNTAASFPFRQIAIYALLLLGISFFVIRLGRNQRYLPVGWFWFVGVLIPVIGIVQVGAQAMADRYTYIPYIGLFLMLAWGVPQLIPNWPYRKVVLGMLMLIVLTALGICSYRQVSYWNNSITLFSHALAVTQNNYIAHNNIGLVYYSLGRNAEAIEEFNQAIKIRPDYAESHTNLGVIYGRLGRCTEAMEAHKQAIKLNPDLVFAYNNLGVAFSGLGRWQDAVEAFGQAIKLKPSLATAHNNLGIAYTRLGRYQDALEAHKQAIKIKPDYAEAHYNLGNAYLAIGDKNSALAEYNILKSLNLQFADNLFNQINK
jgi:tetratricopeptide (TPR) repeat protein